MAYSPTQRCLMELHMEMQQAWERALWLLHHLIALKVSSTVITSGLGLSHYGTQTFKQMTHVTSLKKEVHSYIPLFHIFIYSFIRSYFELNTYYLSNSQTLIVVNNQKFWWWKIQFRHCGKKIWSKWSIMNYQWRWDMIFPMKIIRIDGVWWGINRSGGGKSLTLNGTEHSGN